METIAELSMSDYWLNLKNEKKNAHFYLVQVNYFLGQKLGRKEVLALDQI